MRRIVPPSTAWSRSASRQHLGLAGQDVYDETYRKALKMNPEEFCSTFDPYSLGIVDSVAQTLLPSFLDSTTHRAVEAKLYKLNASYCATLFPANYILTS